ncbi:hypothetical protein [Streptomyces sp. SudanB91_2054]|uniref:hypothetical protein n=1 Tax=Streptomyces sp. SudanB91_2054 TaxID=3035278 RepID=UPI0036DA1A1A
MTDETKPEQPPARSEMEQLRDTTQTLQTIVNRVREAVGTDEPTPVRESFRVRQLQTRVSDAEYERDHARRRAEAASRVGTEYMVRAERAETAIERVRVLATRLEEFAENALKVDDRSLYRAIASDIYTQLDGTTPAPAATNATEDEWTGPLVPPILTEAIQQHDAETERAVAVLAQAYGPMADLDHPQHPINVEKTARVFAALHRSAEDTVTRVIALYEQWVKAGPPPLCTSTARWWDARLVELHNAIQPADQTTEK